MSTCHWGEIIQSMPDGSFNIGPDVEKAMFKLRLPAYDTDDEESENPQSENSQTQNDTISLPPQDPLVLYAISLHKHITHMNEIIRLAQLAIDNNVRPSEDAVPSVPPLPQIHLNHKINCLNFLPIIETDFTVGKEVEIPVLSETIVNKVLRRSICTLVAHLGYELSEESAINLLIDVLRDFFKLLCSKLENTIKDERDCGSCGFPHAIERTLVELGLGGAKGLHDYYNSRVIKYVNVLRGRCQQLNDRYNELLDQRNQSPDVDVSKITSVEVKKEEIEENPEVHLLDGEIELSSLETGFQLLNSLEEANFQNLIEGEEMLTTESPGNVPSDLECSPMTKRIKK